MGVYILVLVILTLVEKFGGSNLEGWNHIAMGLTIVYVIFAPSDPIQSWGAKTLGKIAEWKNRKEK